MNNVIISPEKARADYIRLIEKLGITDDSFIITPKLLLVEQVLSSSKNSYRFDIYETRGSDRPAEVKLNRNDLFVASHLGLALYKQDTSVTPAQYANRPFFTNPNPEYFVGNNGEAAALETVYRGLLSINTKPVDRIQELHTSLFRYVPERPYNSTDGYLEQQGPGLEQRGMFPVVPNIIFDGKEDNIITLDLGPGSYAGIEGTVDGAGAAVDTRNVLVLQLFGWVVLNGAESANRWTNSL